MKITDALRRIPPLGILAFGWGVFLVYAFPGFMSFDSVYQLGEARAGIFSDAHPPAMAELWRVCEWFVAGPVGLLIIQTWAFLGGAYVACSRRMSARAGAVMAVLLLWFPPIASVMAVIWKDAQMAGFLMLGFGLVGADRRRTKLLGLGAYLMATLMRHNALVVTGPLIFFGFVWRPHWRWWVRYPLATATWAIITFAAQTISTAMTDHQNHLATNTLALCDIAGTLRYVEPDIPDDELRRELAGMTIRPEHDLNAFARTVLHNTPYLDTLWWTANHMFAKPRTDEQRAAVVRAWKTIVFGHRRAYWRYRWEVFSRLLGLKDHDPNFAPVYEWYLDIDHLDRSAAITEHDASASRLGDELREAMQALGRTSMFDLVFYIVLVLVLLPFAIGDHEVLGALVAAVTNELALFPAAPSADWRYSFWLVVGSVLALVLIVARRMRQRPAASTASAPQVAATSQ